MAQPTAPSWVCIDGTPLVAKRFPVKCSCGDDHDHVQGECPTCGYVRNFHPSETAAAITAWNAANPTKRI